MSAVADLRTATEQLRATMALVVDMIIELEDADTAVEILRGVHIAEKCAADALRELQTPEDPRPVEPPKAPEEPAQSEDDPRIRDALRRAYEALAHVQGATSDGIRDANVKALASALGTIQGVTRGGEAENEDDPADGALVLDLLDRQNLRAALDRLERGIVDLAGVRDQDGEALHDVADAAKVFRYELELDEVQP